ncbi:MAG: enoyl-CoA hydratase/isomerase family protein [Betaproteobacteria bacterium]|nr:enoyl-CoA hydratase/isomerase family protein [Betaproteobacteria bacterium]
MSVQVSVDNYIATVVLDRPAAMNSVDQEMRQELHQTWERIRSDEDIRVAIITGAGEKAFCTGSDLKKTMPTQETFAQQIYAKSSSSALTAGLDFDKALIAAINGYAIGGGMELALACDIRIASDNAQFALSEVKIGSVPGTGGTQRLPRAVGLSDAMLMLLTGDRIDAQEAYRIGLVSRVVPAAQLMPAALEIAAKIAANAPLSVRAIKRLVRQGMDMPLAHAIDVERYALGLLYNTEDRIEGRKAFAEKRKPNYKGK